MEMSALLRRGRRLLQPEIEMLGRFERRPSRIGKRVTQEEIAEAAGVSRVWYAMLERGARIDISTGLLGRLADVLMLGETDRSALFTAGVQGHARTTMQPEARAVIDAFSWVRSASRRLWSASTEIEALTIATEALAERFRNASVVHNRFRHDDGGWRFPMFLGGKRATARTAEFIRSLTATLGPEGMDELHGYPRFLLPGDIYAQSAAHSNAHNEEVWLSASIRQQRAPLLAAYGMGTWSFLHGRVQSRRGWVAGIIVADPKRTYVEEERAAMGTVTELTSLALS
jgi:transcriptional regulator with XRE-family HTH domain